MYIFKIRELKIEIFSKCEIKNRNLLSISGWRKTHLFDWSLKKTVDDSRMRMTCMEETEENTNIGGTYALAAKLNFPYIPWFMTESIFCITEMPIFTRAIKNRHLSD